MQLELYLHFFILKLLVFLGYAPELYFCVKCKKKILPGYNRFNFNRGGIVCGECKSGKEGLTITDNCIKLLRLVIKEKIGKLSKVKVTNNIANETINIIRSFLQFYKL